MALIWASLNCPSCQISSFWRTVNDIFSILRLWAQSRYPKIWLCDISKGQHLFSGFKDSYIPYSTAWKTLILWENTQNWGEADFLTELQQSSTLCFLLNKFLPRRWFSGREKEVVGSTSASKVGIPIGPWLWYTWYVWRGKRAAPNLSPIWQAEVRWCLRLCFTCTWSADLWPPLGTLVRHLNSDPETWPRNNWALGQHLVLGHRNLPWSSGWYPNGVWLFCSSPADIRHLAKIPALV